MIKYSGNLEVSSFWALLDSRKELNEEELLNEDLDVHSVHPTLSLTIFPISLAQHSGKLDAHPF